MRGPPTPAILLSFSQNFSKHCLARFYMFSNRFWLIWGNLKFTKFSIFWEKRARKVFRGLKTEIWGGGPYRPQYENISTTSQKFKSVEKKKLGILVWMWDFFKIFLENPKFEFTNPTKKVGSRFQTRKTPRIWLLHVFSRILTNLCQFLAKRIAQLFFSKLPRFLFKNWRSD